MATSSEKRRRIEELARELCEELGEVDASKGDCWLDAIENQAVEVGDAITTALIAQQAARRQPQPAEANCPECGQLGRCRGDRQRELLSRRGPVPIAEPEYFCPCCRKAFFPLDPSDRR